MELVSKGIPGGRGRSWKNGIRSILNMSWIQEAEMPEALEGRDGHFHEVWWEPR